MVHTPPSTKKQSKRLRQSYAAIESVAKSPAQLEDVVKQLKQAQKDSGTKFDETIDMAINLGVDVRHSDQQVRGVIALPHGVGKEVRVAVFARDAKAEEAKKAGANLVGAEDLVETVQKGEIAFDRCIATPDMMPVVSKVARVLGPRGLMPNPKLGTVTEDITKAVEAAKSGQVEYKTEKGGVVHAGVGKISFAEKDLIENIHAFMQTIIKAKPSGAKGVYLKKISISTTMGPSVLLDVAQFKKAA